MDGTLDFDCYSLGDSLCEEILKNNWYFFFQFTPEILETGEIWVINDLAND